jgi:CheY-like chemotaxis protein
VDGSLTRKHGGTGLGLAISRQLVTMMGGHIGFGSSEGRGSKFWFEIPVERSERPTALEGKLGGFVRALVVDDNQTNLAILRDLLSGWGMEVACATHGAEALELLTRASRSGAPYQLAVIDFQMPEMHGGELARRMRIDLGLASLPIVMLASLGAGELGDARQHIDETLTKPVRQGELRRAVELALRGRESGARAFRPSPLPVADGPKTSLRFVGRPHLLVAEDNPINQEVMVEILAQFGCTADLVDTGRAALDAILAHDYPVVLMDCQMPVLDGYEAVGQLRARGDAKSRTPVVAVTAHAVAGERQKAIAAGMDDYVSKPVSPETLHTLLARWLPVDVSRASTPPSAASAALPPVTEVEPDLDPSRGRSPRVCALFLSLVPGQIDALLLSVSASDHDGVKAGAHKLRGSALSIGAVKLAALCERLEADPTDGALPEQVKLAHDVVRRELGRLISAPAAV